MSGISKKKVDNIVVGSSPLCLIESIHLTHIGKKVILIESSDRLGGQWATVDFNAFENVEIGPHLIKPREGLYQFLNDLGLKMYPMSPSPIRAIEKSFLDHNFVPYDWRWFDTYRQKINSSFFLLKPYYFLRFYLTILKHLIKKYLLNGGVKINYFKGGSQEMIDHLVKIAEHIGVEIKKNTTIKKVRVHTKNKEVNVYSESDSFSCEELIYTSGTKIRDVMIDDNCIEMNDKPQNYLELLLLVNDPDFNDFSFAVFPEYDALIRMVSNATDYTSYSAGSKAEHKIITIRLTDSNLKDNSTIKSIIERLKKYKFISKNSTLEDYKWIDINVPHRRVDRISELNKKTMPWLRAIYTYDIGVSILNNIERWSTTLTWLKKEYKYLND